MEDYTIDKIQELDDAIELITIAEEWGVGLDGLNTNEEMKEQLILHILKLNNQRYFRFDDERFAMMKMEEENKRNAIIDLFKKVRTSLGSGLKSISSILKSGNISEDLSQDIDSHIEDLQTGECCVVFAGETSSGKSSLLNIVLGVDILPTHALSCTFLICKLKYSETYRSKIIYSDLKTEKYEYSTAEEAKRSLNKIIFERNQQTREESSNIKEVEIYLPAELLKTGVIIVDTPGFGENTELNSKVAKFLSSTSITGFVYLIRTDVGGGVQEDRLLDFLRDIKRLRGKNSMLKISEETSPSAAMFICNRWDIIEENHRDSVRANAISKLTDAWPELKETQIKFFSTENAAKHVRADRDYITKDFADLLNQIVELMQSALETRVKQHYRWLKRILYQTSNLIRSMISQINKTDEELQQKFREADEKIKHLKSNAEITVSRLYQKINKENEKLIGKIKMFLQSPEIKILIRQWDINMETAQQRRQSLMSLSASVNPVSPPNPYEIMALRHLVDEIDNWVKQNKYDVHVTSELERTISSKFETLKIEMAEINDEMKDGQSLSSDSSCSTIPDDELFEMLTCVKKARRRKLMAKIEDVAQENPDSISRLKPKVLIAKAIITAMNISRGGRRISVLNNDPKLFVKEKAIAFLNVLIKDDKLLQKLCLRYTESLQQYVENIEASIPMFVATNESLMEEITSSRKEEVNNKDTLKQIIERLDNVRELLKGFECFYVKVLRSESVTFPRDDITSVLSTSSKQSLEDSLTSSGCSAYVNGIFLFGQLGSLKLPENDIPIAIMSRKSNFDLSEDMVFKETARLRNLKSESVASFLGMIRQNKKAVYIFSGNLHPINRYMSKPHITDIKGLTMKIINGTVNGLAALHKNELVHMELTPKTIMIDADNEEVKLFGGCLPQKPSFSLQNHSEKVGYLQYLSPEVLQGTLYTASDDIYSLALVIWKLTFHQDPFRNQEFLDQETFIRTVNPQTMLEFKDEWPEKLKELFIRCVFYSPSDRLNIENVKEYLSQIDMKNIICDERPPRRRNVVNRMSRSSQKQMSAAF